MFAYIYIYIRMHGESLAEYIQVQRLVLFAGTVVETICYRRHVTIELFQINTLIYPCENETQELHQMV